MLGLLVKVIVVAAIVATAGWYITRKDIKLNPSQLSTQAVAGLAKKIDVSSVSGQISQVLDSLVTNQKSPVILGVQVSNQTIGLVTDAILKLPNDQLEQVKQAVCAPAQR